MPETPSGSIRLEAPDRNFRLTQRERERIVPGYDADALERLLAAVEAAVRPFLLSRFIVPEDGSGRMPGVMVLMGDPKLQPLLDEVWAPMWELYPDMLDTETKDYPGREIARERRARRLQQE
jgi:hypothetical protein